MESLDLYQDQEWVTLTDGMDVSELLGIVKWEAPPEFKSADAKGSFPSFIFKTDQERVQNCFRNMERLFDSVTWEESEKCEGSSLTAYFRKTEEADPGEFGVCSRNLNLKRSEENTFWKAALSYDLESKMTALGKNIAIQAELCGPGIQENIYGLTTYKLFVFDVFDINTQTYYTPYERRALTAELGLTDAPVLRKNVDLFGETCESMLKFADGKSVIGTSNTLREGLVYKANSKKRISFKAVSDLYLEKQND